MPFADSVQQAGAGAEDDLDRGALVGAAVSLADLEWLVRLRWWAMVAVAVTALAASHLGIIGSATPLLAVAAVVTALNVGWAWTTRRARVAAAGPPWVRVVFAQLLLDLVALAVLLHLAGGAENPFVVFFTFHMALGAILLPRRPAWALAAAAAVIQGSIVLAEYAGWLPHYAIHFAGEAHVGGRGEWSEPFYSEASHVGAHLLAFWCGLVGVVYFTRTVRERQREAELRRSAHERIARSRARLARIGEIAAGVAHTVRNPLHGALNCIDLLAADPALAGAPAQEILELQREGLQRIERVTRRLLTLTREAPLHRDDADIAALAAEAARLASVRARGRGVDIACDVVEGLRASIDADRTVEALLNLLDNAVDAAPTGSTVRLAARRLAGSQEAPDEACLEWAIEDQGPGIPEAARARVFDPFFSTKPVGEGSGLGLAIARRVAEEHAGTIAIEDRPGGGARLVVRVPLGVASAGEV